MTIASQSISLIVSTVNRAVPLGTLLRSLELQSYANFEVIVVVGPAHDNTQEVLSAYAGRITVLPCPSANLSQSRNIGILASRGDIVAFIDDDAVPCRCWLEQLNRLFALSGLDGTGGVVYLVHPRHPVVQHRQGIVSSLSEHTDVRSSGVHDLVPTGAGSQWVGRPMGTNMAFRRTVLLEAGGFDEFYQYIAEETDLALRLARAGRTVHPVKQAAVYHVPASSHNREVFTQRGRWWRQATRSWTYFCIRNGRPSGETRRSVARRCLSFVHGHWETYLRLHRGGELSSREVAGMGLGDLSGLLGGIVGGLSGPRRLIPQAVSEQALSTVEPLQLFQNPASACQPAVDPVNARQPNITIIDPPLRICLLSHTYPPSHYDGVGRLTNLMAQGLFQLGHSVHVVSGGDHEQVSFYDGAFVHRIPYALDRYPSYKRFTNLHHALNNSHAVYDQVRRLMLNDGIQIVDSPLWLFEGLVTLVSGMAPVVARLVTAGRQVAGIHGDRGEDARLVGEMEKLLIQRAHHVLPNTLATLAAAESTYDLHLSRSRCTVVPYGIVPAAEEATRPFDPDHPPQTLMVLFVGRLEKRKGVTDLFEAIPLVVDRIPNARFVFAGDDNSRHDGFQNETGMDYPTYFAERQKKYAASVSFTGAVGDEDLQRLYQSCDLFVAPSLYESFGLVYVEAMNYAKPVIGCHAGGIPEVVDDGVTGLLVPPQEPRALAGAIISLLSSPERLRDMGMAGRAQVLARFSHVQMARDFERVYRAVIREFPSGQLAAGPASDVCKE
jgi:glycogen synthase